MSRTDFNTLLEAGAHFGHLKRKWNPKMAPYIFMEKNGIHIIDLHKTVLKIDEAAAAIKQIAKSGRRVLFVATKKQAKDIVAEKVAAVGPLFGQMVNEIQNEYGTLICSEMSQPFGDFDSKPRKKNCMEIIAYCARLTCKYAEK